MQTILLDASRYTTSRELHEALKSMLSLPDYYGMNADALHDCLAERKEQIRFWVIPAGESEVARALSAVCAAAEDLDVSITEI